VVLHDPNLAASFCDSVLVLDKGRVCGFGPPKGALTREVLKSVFGVDVVTLVHPATGAPVFVPS
jgi:iron complex transport system ATP-binding protein